MKQFWVDIRPWNKEIATTAIESGADALVVDKAEDVRRLGRITTVAPDGDLKPGKDVIELTITDKKSENKAAADGQTHSSSSWRPATGRSSRSRTSWPSPTRSSRK